MPEEEEACDARLIVAVNRGGQMCFCKQVGSVGVAPEIILEMLSVARAAAAAVIDEQNAALEKEAKEQRPKQFIQLN